ncbi:hypothetical protein UlMin_036116 [Ulmus minor]
MENYSNYSYPDSRDSSPRSREIDSENQSWDEPPSSYKAKFMCSYGGKIQPRPHDNQLAYVGGDTKILAVDRNIKLSAFLSKLASICDSEVCFKYQLPGEDLDALISVTNEEDLEHLMLEYDRLFRASAKPARLRLFLFPENPSAPTSFGSNEAKSERQWFVDALNSVQIQSLEGASPPAPAAATPPNPDFLFGFDKGYAPVPGAKFPDSVPPPTVPDSIAKEVSAGSDCGSEDRHQVGEPVVSPAEIQRQIHELQRLQIANHEQAMYQRKLDELGNPRAYTGDYYSQKPPEKMAPPPAPVPVQVPVSIPAGYMQERHMNTGGYHVGAPTGTEQQVYFIPTQGGMYQAPAMRPMTGPVGQPYYGMQRVMQPEVYREAPPPVYNQPMPQQQMMQQPKVEQQQQQQQGYTQVGYDSAGRPVYYTATAGAVSSYQTMAPVTTDGRQGGSGGAATGGGLNQEGKVGSKPSM